MQYEGSSPEMKLLIIPLLIAEKVIFGVKNSLSLPISYFQVSSILFPPPKLLNKGLHFLY